MTSNLATNSKLNSEELFGSPVFLRTKHNNPNVPLEDQIQLTCTATSNVVGSPAASRVVPSTDIWDCRDDPTAGTVVYTLTAAQLRNMLGRKTVFAFSGTLHAANSVTVVLPAEGEFVVTGGAAGLTSMTIAPNVRTAVELFWTYSEGVAGDYRVVVIGNTTGFTFA